MSPPQSPSRKTPPTLVLFCLFLAFLKLWLISQDEVIARDIPDQQLWFVKAALELMNFNWLGAYTPATLSHSPIYPLWIVLVNQLGFPLRIGTEFLLIFSALFFIITLFKAGLPTWLSCLLFFLIITNPTSLWLNREVLSESLFAPFFLLILSAMLRLLLSREHHDMVKFSVLMGLATSVLWQLGMSHLLLIGSFIFFYALYYYLAHSNSPRMAVIILIPFFLIATTSVLIRSINYFRYKSFLVTERTRDSNPLPSVSKSPLDILGHFFRPMPIYPQRDDPTKVSADSIRLFDQIAKRRADKTKPFPLIKISGWAYNETKPIVRLEIRDLQGNVLGSTHHFIERKDVLNYFKIQEHREIPANTGFQLEFSGGMKTSQLTLALVNQDGNEFLFPLTQKGSISTPRYSIDTLDFQDTPSSLPWETQRLIGEYYGPALLGLSLGAFLFVIYFIFRHKKIDIQDPLFFSSLLFLAILLLAGTSLTIQGRRHPLSLMDLTRSLDGIAPLFTSLVILLIYQTLRRDIPHK